VRRATVLGSTMTPVRLAMAPPTRGRARRRRRGAAVVAAAAATTAAAVARAPSSAFASADPHRSLLAVSLAQSTAQGALGAARPQRRLEGAPSDPQAQDAHLASTTGALAATTAATAVAAARRSGPGRRRGGVARYTTSGFAVAGAAVDAVADPGGGVNGNADAAPSSLHEAPPAVADSRRVQRLKDLVLIREMRVAITSGEFALRLGGAERPGLVDYEGLCNRLNSFEERLSRQAVDSEVLPQEDVWKAQEDIKRRRESLEERLGVMLRRSGPSSVGPAGAEEAVPTAPAPAGGKEQLETSRILLYLRDDQTVDIDSALKASLKVREFSTDLWERLKGTSPKDTDEWDQGSGALPKIPPRVVSKQMFLDQAKKALADAEEKRTSILKATQRQVGRGAEAEPQADLTPELFKWDRSITGYRILELLANVDLLSEQVATELEAQLEAATGPEWDAVGRRLKLLVFEFSLLDKQVAPYQRFMRLDPEKIRTGGIDPDELRMLEAHIHMIAVRLGIQVQRVGERRSFLTPLKRRLSSMWRNWTKVRRGVMFYASGTQLLWQDLQHTAKLVLKVVFQKYTLKPCEVQVCWRFLKDITVLVPFLIILLIPMSPPGHMLVFSLIIKIYPDFFPSPFTERRQNVMKIYNEIKPASERVNTWA